MIQTIAGLDTVQYRIPGVVHFGLVIADGDLFLPSFSLSLSLGLTNSTERGDLSAYLLYSCRASLVVWSGDKVQVGRRCCQSHGGRRCDAMRITNWESPTTSPHPRNNGGRVRSQGVFPIKTYLSRPRPSTHSALELRVIVRAAAHSQQPTAINSTPLPPLPPPPPAIIYADGPPHMCHATLVITCTLIVLVRDTETSST